VSAPWIIVGQGLAGTCLAWELWRRGAGFLLVDREAGGSSRVAAGLINPVTGKNFEPTPRVGMLLPEALDFYRATGELLGNSFWHPLPILRLAETAKEWEKMLTKRGRADVSCWLAAGGAPLEEDGWCGAMELTGGGRLDTRAFLDASRGFFRDHGVYQNMEIDPATQSGARVWCDGAAGLLSGRHGPHRCAKGEILTLHAPGWPQSHIRIGDGGWLVPLGGGRFKSGATYEWDRLDETPTAAGLEKVAAIARRLGGDGSFEILAHEAGVRPIIRRSEPVIGPIHGGDWMFNGLGSKGSLFAPGMARRLADRILDGSGPEPAMSDIHGA